jgi:uncharacterized membrane protein YedE/YeeE
MLEGMSDGAIVALIGFGGGLLLGLAARLGRFCTLGSIEDFLYAGSDIRLRMWGLAIGTAMLGSFALVAFDLLDITQSIYIAASWNPLASIIGGLLFGYGMALAGTCGFGALARLGGGDLRSFVIVLVMGITAYMTIAGPLASLRLLAFSNGLDTDNLHGYADLLGNALNLPHYMVGLVIGASIVAFVLTSKTLRADSKSILWGVVVGIAVVSGWAGTQYISDTGFDEVSVISHTYSAPLGETLIFLMTSSGGGLSFGVGSVFGVLSGAFIGSLIKGHFRWEACEDPRELRRQILGAVCMGVGAVVALGCTIGQGISAFSVLSFSAPITFAAIFAGAAFGLKQLITGFEAFS